MSRLRNILVGLRNIWVFLPAVWGFRPYDFAYTCRILGVALGEQRDHLVEREDVSAETCADAAELAFRLGNDLDGGFVQGCRTLGSILAGSSENWWT